MSYNSDLQSNNEELLEILNAVNELPEAGSGEPGADGFSPIATVTQTDDGAVISITDKNGTTTANINHGNDGCVGPVGPKGDKGDTGETGPKGDTGETGPQGPAGANGTNGTSVTVSNVSESTASGGTNVVTFSDGKKVNIKNGTDGKTPVKGVDYFTEADKEEFLQDIDAVKKEDVFDTRQTVTPDYDNAIHTSIDTDGSVYNGCGYIAGKYINFSGTLSDDDHYASGFIPVKKGDIVRIRDSGKSLINYGTCLILCKSPTDTTSGISRSVAAIQGNAVYGSMTVNGDTITWDTSNITYYYWENFAYLRVSFKSPDAVVTINQELTESVKEQLVLKPSVKVTKESFDGETHGKPLVGKTVVCFGDSLFGMDRGEDSAPAFVAEYTGATVYNVGFGGCRMSVHPTNGYGAFSMWALAKAVAENSWATQDAQVSSGASYFPEQLSLLKSVDFSKVDMVVIHYGTNDFAAGSAITIDNDNDPDDYNTLCGALRYSVEKLLGKYPKLQIYVSLPVYRFWTENNVTTYAEDYVKHNHTLPDFVEALRNTSTEYNLPVIDGYHGMGVNKYNASAYLSDGTHHNVDGRKLFGEFIGGHLISKQTVGKSGVDTTAVNALITAAIGNAIGGSY